MKTASVYRAYDIDGRLLYVGCSTRPADRLRWHRTQSPFGALIARTEVDQPMDVTAANKDEQRQIAELAPPYNVSGNVQCGWPLTLQRTALPAAPSPAPEAVRSVGHSFNDGMFPRCKWPGCNENRNSKAGFCWNHADLHANHKNGNGGAKPNLTDEQRADIRKRMSRFENPKTIAKLYGVTTRTVHAAMKKAS